jgi:hypothetical protein
MRACQHRRQWGMLLCSPCLMACMLSGQFCTLIPLKGVYTHTQLAKMAQPARAAEISLFVAACACHDMVW